MSGVRNGTLAAVSIAIATLIFARIALRGSLAGRFNGAVGVLLLALLAGLSALSVGWSLLPNTSLVAALQLISYTCVFALAALAAQFHGERSREVAIGLALAALVLATYALLSACLPTLFGDDSFARLRQPFGYWNAVGAISAIGLLLWMWVGTRRDAARWSEVLSLPAGGLTLVALMLTQSRGVLAMLLLTIVVWLVLVPRRLRSAGWLIAVGLVSLPVVAWAYSTTALSTDNMPLDQRRSAGIILLLALIALVVVLTFVGKLLRRRRLKRPLKPAARTRLGRRLLIALGVLAVLAAVVVSVAGSRGLGTIPHEVGAVFSTTVADPDNSPSRLMQTSSPRAGYWGEAVKVFRAHPLGGTGADSFLVSRVPHTTNHLPAAHAHSMVFQNAADLGIAGVAITLALALVWLLAAAKLVGVGRRTPTKWLAEADELKIAAVAITLAALLFGLQSAIDWTWFVPGLTWTGLLAGGWVLGLDAAHTSRPAAVSTRTRPLLLRRLTAAAIVVIGLIVAWAAYQPVRAQHKVSKGLEIAHDDPAGALELGRAARRIDPTSPQAWVLISVAQTNDGKRRAAGRTLLELARSQPSNPDNWLRLARFRITQLDDLDGAVEALGPVFYLSPGHHPAQMLLEVMRQQRVEELQQRAAEARRKELERLIKQAAALQQPAATAPSP